ncbi:MAG TPA: hypothetical protein PK909_04590 [Sphaerochaeta sp.]|jgi:hypothetical protein|nr:hypothetical protein [Sphaerochaeta sp.]HQB54735.1 hypothetical protein [Sphaerochaeta sp.]
MYMSVKEAALKWGISERRVRVLCEEGRVDGVVRTSWAWNIPFDAPKPSDGRTLRHMKNLDLRLGRMEFSRFEEQKEIIRTSDPTSLRATYHALLPKMILGLFRLEGISIEGTELAILYSQSFLPNLSFETQLVALNMRSLLNRMLTSIGLGSIQGNANPKMSEQRLHYYYGQLLQGLDDAPPAYEERIVIQEGKRYPIPHQMELLFIQYEQEWRCLHPVVRSLFLFGELMRIRPFGHYDWFIASLAFSEEMLKGGYLPTLLESEDIDEFRSALLLTNSKGNYQNLLALIEQQQMRAVSRLTVRSVEGTSSFAGFSD